MKPIVRQTLGGALITLPFASLFALLAGSCGAVAAVTAFGITYAVVAVLAFGVHLLFD